MTSLRYALRKRNDEFDSLKLDMEKRTKAWEKQRAALVRSTSWARFHTFISVIPSGLILTCFSDRKLAYSNFKNPQVAQVGTSNTQVSQVRTKNTQVTHVSTEEIHK